MFDDRKTVEVSLDRVLPLPASVRLSEDNAVVRSQVLLAIEEMDIEKMFGCMRANCIHGLTQSDCVILEEPMVLSIS